jgi:ADP-ribosylglycohydrolase
MSQKDAGSLVAASPLTAGGAAPVEGRRPEKPEFEVAGLQMLSAALSVRFFRSARRASRTVPSVTTPLLSSRSVKPHGAPGASGTMAAWTMTGLCGLSAACRLGELRAGSHIGPFIFAARTHVAREYGALGLALDALEGLSVGDALGEQFFLATDRVRVAIAQRWHPVPPWYWTDDTNMALSIVEVLIEHGSIEADQLAASFARRYDPARGYGPSMHAVLGRIGDGEPWQAVARGQFGGRGSFGNGAAMRVAPLGAWFSEDLDRVADEAHRSSIVTHAHPEAAAGAVAVAVAAAIAAQGRGRPALRAGDFLEAVRARVPPSEVGDGLGRAVELDSELGVERVVSNLGSGQRVSAQDTVPFALWSAAQTPDDFTETFWRTVSGLGDRDTTCAIACGVVAARTGIDGIPPLWRASREPLPAWVTAA